MIETIEVITNEAGENETTMVTLGKRNTYLKKEIGSVRMTDAETKTLQNVTSAICAKHRTQRISREILIDRGLDQDPVIEIQENTEREHIEILKDPDRGRGQDRGQGRYPDLAQTPIKDLIKGDKAIHVVTLRIFLKKAIGSANIVVILTSLGERNVTYVKEVSRQTQKRRSMKIEVIEKSRILTCRMETEAEMILDLSVDVTDIVVR